VRYTLIGFGFLAFLYCATTSVRAANNEDPPIGPNQDLDLAVQLGIHFVNESTTKVIVESSGKSYEVDLATRQIRELPEPAQNQTATEQVTPQAKPDASSSTGNQQSESKTNTRRYYRPGDDFLFTLPTGRPIEKHSWTLNFTHRLPYEAAFTGEARGATLLGFDDFAIPSFGVQYGVTSRFAVSVYRSPSVIGRPIELGAKYSLLDERHGPFNATFRFSVDGQDDFSRNFTSNFELQASRSLGRRAQLYVVPTLSLHNRPVLSDPSSLEEPPAYQPCAQQLANGVPASMQVHPCANTFSVGFGAAIDIRPTVALVGEVIPTAVNGTELGIHRLPFSFGIQKKIYHHAFTFGLTTAPGTETSQRIATRSVFLLDPHADTPSGMFVGFDIMRQLP
jgi:hypothetical protein